MIATYFARSRTNAVVFKTKDDPEDAREAQRDLMEAFGILVDIRPWEEKYRRTYQDGFEDEPELDINGRVEFFLCD